MATAAEKTKPKRPSRGMRKHNRRLKQEANRLNLTGVKIKKKRRPA